MRLVLLVILCSTLISAIDDEKTTIKAAEKEAEKPTEKPAKDENAKTETVRILSDISLV